MKSRKFYAKRYRRVTRRGTPPLSVGAYEGPGGGAVLLSHAKRPTYSVDEWELKPSEAMALIRELTDALNAIGCSV